MPENNEELGRQEETRTVAPTHQHGSDEAPERDAPDEERMPGRPRGEDPAEGPDYPEQAEAEADELEGDGQLM